MIAVAYDGSIPTSHYDIIEGSGTYIARVPIRISGVPKGDVIDSDELEFRLLDANNRILYETRLGAYPRYEANRDGASWLLWRHDEDGDILTHASFSIPPEVYIAIKEHPVTIRLNYKITFFDPAVSGTIGLAEGKEAIVPELGNCKSQKVSYEDMIKVECFSRAVPRHCVSIFAENMKTGARNPPELNCWWYQGTPSNVDFSTIPFSMFYFLGPHLAGNAQVVKRPVDMAQRADSRLMISTYQPVATFEREVVSPPLLIDSLRDAPLRAETK